MKIHSIQQSICGWRSISRQAMGPSTVCFALAICIMLGGQSQAQVTSAAYTSPQNPAASSKIGSMFTHGNDAYRVVSVADYNSNPDISQAAASTIAQAGCFLDGKGCGSNCGSSCSSCGGHGSQMSCGGACGGTCSSCGNHAAMAEAYGMGSACPTCEPYWYGSIEALNMRRTRSGRFSESPDFFLSGFDYQWAPRVTIGAVPDCVHGYEVSFTGQFNWDRAGYFADPSGGIGTILVAIPPVNQADLSAFDNAIEKAQIFKSQYWSMEASNTMVGWDVAKLISGLRYISYDETFSVFSRNATETGFLRSDINNQLFGYQVGIDLLYPICHKTYTDLRARAGVYANFVDLNFQVINAGSTTALLIDESTKLAGQVELGSGIRYEFSQALSIRGGFELWYIDGIASAKDQFSGGILARRSVRAKDDFLVAGWNVGAEFRY